MLVQSIYEKDLLREEIQELLRYIDWLMVLPEELAEEFDRTVQQYEEENKMPYVTS